MVASHSRVNEDDQLMLNCNSEYIVEAQDMDDKGKWVELGTVDPAKTQLKVKGLKNKGNYKFRYERMM